MFAFKDSTRILIIGMIITLSITLANAHICYSAYQTVEGGYNPGPGKALCGDGTKTYSCTLTACISVHQIFQRCSTDPKMLPGTMNVRVLSYALTDNILSVATGGKRAYCPNDAENKVKISFCPDADCDKGV
ncbi:hypothetical protein MJO28_012853 [Puccinia striiformis f. sp. tritici]|uniref:Uncharacterized protein n=1 Tax=Puccinia striiformis f. sp. tritici TaxID=168172 RepID=A0ACC0DYK6_9BASI|nr:hypothetical protein MJO28_012853 [Puccinia striiformis f. sp. tritici]KAI7943373.1 hypothetical protein MJO29_013217 [Puccinia striiformis f. sp. tritici]